MKNVAILEAVENVKRHSLRVKNAGNKLLYAKGKSIINKMIKSTNTLKATELEQSYLNMIKEEYSNTITGIAVNHSLVSMADAYGPGDPQIDFDQISVFEGTQQTDGYVPKDKSGEPIDKSGVTIGTGVDIGQMSENQIQNLDISPELKEKLIDYAGLTGLDAVNALKENPLNISEAEADELDKVVKGNATDSLVNSFNEDTANVNFLALPPEIQTAIASVSYQYGDLSKSCPNFWADITENRWEDAENELRNFGDHFKSRRTAEAELFRQGIEKLKPK